MSPTTVTEVSEIEMLVVRAASGDDAAWHALWRAIEPDLEHIIGHPSFLGRLGQREDDRRNIIVEIIGRLAADDRRRLRTYVETRAANPSLRFITWLRVVAKRVGIDYQRGHAQYLDRRRQATPASSPGKWIEPSPLPNESQLGGDRPPVTDHGTARQLAAFATHALPEDQQRALAMWVESDSYEAIAQAIGCATAAEAEKKVRAAIERLRRKFREEPA